MVKFIDTLIRSIESKNSHVCVGLDSRYDRLPEEVTKNTSVSQAIFSFNKEIIAVTHDIAAVYKMNVAFYAGFGAQGLEGLRLTNEYLKSTYPDIPLLADCKRSEMGESVNMVKQEIFDWLQFDCVMVTPWFGFDTVKDYLRDESRGVVVYLHDSNPSASEFQDVELVGGSRLYEYVAKRVSTVWNTNGNIIVEAGATYPKELRQVRRTIGEDMVLLTAGIGIQGGEMDAVKGLFGTNNARLLVNSSRGIIFAGVGKQDYFAEVRKAAVDFQVALRIASGV